jgi:alpha-ketoglutarate-dependent taurine dioxygenase
MSTTERTRHLEIRPVDATLGAVVTGVDLRDLDDAEWTAIEDAFHEYAVLVLPGQFLEAEEQETFARRWGDIEQVQEGRMTAAISNLHDDGTMRAEDDHLMKLLKGTQGWHTDSSFMPVSAKASMLTAKVVPDEGGETEWADLRAGYDALDDETRQRISGLTAKHSLFYSLGVIGLSVEKGAGYGFQHDGVPVRPLVKQHPVTGRMALFVGMHAHGIEGMSDLESAELIGKLIDDACQPPRVYTHKWQVGDLVMWDNRCVLHRGRPYDPKQARVLAHTRVAGDPATESAPLSDTD